MTVPFTPPLADIQFVLNRLIGVRKLSVLSGYEAITPDLVEPILIEAGRIAAERFAPLNEIGDKKGAAIADGVVTTAPGFREAYRAFVDGGWNSVAAEIDYGGQGLPWLLAMSVQEMMQSANISLALCPLLTQGAVELLSSHGSEMQKRNFLPKLVSGEWAGTMNLTEPQAGSDVGAVRTKAVKDGDHYRITGQKIYISYGDHDLTENIIHLILARLPDAPEGTRGLSLFLVPKILVNEDGSLGAPNDVRAVSLEHKLGQHGSPTCTMAYGDKGGAIGYLVGEENGGIAMMFVMMNNARIGVGIQGLGIMERAYQHARDFAKTRVQSRAIDNPKGGPVTIINHPDVRRMLMSMKAHTEAARALAYRCGYTVDVAKHAKGDAQKAQAAARVDVLTPIVKAWLTDLANEVASTGVQIFGGMGYIEETGAAQFMRDARVLAIYEGTNGIQANDLVFRKLAKDKGVAFNEIIDEMETYLRELPMSADQVSTTLRLQMTAAITAMKKASVWIFSQVTASPAAAAASAAPFLRLCGNVLGGYYLLRSANVAQQDLASGTGSVEFLTAKIATARFYATHVLPQCTALGVIVQEGAKPTVAVTEAMF